jgi:hypothetical protein
VLGSAGSPFSGSPFAWVGHGGRDWRGEGEEEEKKKKKKKTSAGTCVKDKKNKKAGCFVLILRFFIFS